MPEGARSFHLVVAGNSDGMRLIDPSGREYRDPTPTIRQLDREFQVLQERHRMLTGAANLSADEREQLREVSLRREETYRALVTIKQQVVAFRGGYPYRSASTEATSDWGHSYEDVVVPGEWTVEVSLRYNPSEPAVVVVKTRNDADDKVRLRLVNATSQPNEAFTQRLDRLVELAERLGVNMEISAIEKIPHLANPHALPGDFCERFCSSDEAVALITEPGSWWSPGTGIALKIPHNTHFNLGVELATSKDDWYLYSAMHELLHYTSGLDHLYETHVDDAFDVDGLAATGVYNEVVGSGTRIAGGVNHQRLREAGRLLWNYNALMAAHITPNVRDVDGFGWTDNGGRRYALVTFLEHHQLEWLKNSPLYW